MLIHVFSTITKCTDDNTAEYVCATLFENLCDDDTRDMIRGILTEVRTPKFAAVICDRLFKILDVIEKQERKKQQKQKKASPATTKTHLKTNTPPKPIHMPTMIEEEPNPPSIDNTTPTGDKEEVPTPPGNFNIDDEFTTTNTTTELRETTPTNTTRPKTNTNTTHTQPKDRQKSVIANSKTKKAKKKQKQKQTTPLKSKTTHKIKQPSVNVEEIH